MNARTVSFSIFQAAENIPTSRDRKLCDILWLQQPAARLVPGRQMWIAGGRGGGAERRWQHSITRHQRCDHAASDIVEGGRAGEAGRRKELGHENTKVAA